MAIGLLSLIKLPTTNEHATTTAVKIEASRVNNISFGLSEISRQKELQIGQIKK